MIGHYLLTLSEEQENRVLTTRLGLAGSYVRADGCRCLVGAALDLTEETWRNDEKLRAYGEHFAAPIGYRRSYVGYVYDRLCARFSEGRVNNAIRNRILSNRARRVLQNRPVEAVR